MEIFENGDATFVNFIEIFVAPVETKSRLVSGFGLRTLKLETRNSELETSQPFSFGFRVSGDSIQLDKPA